MFHGCPEENHAQSITAGYERIGFHEDELAAVLNGAVKIFEGVATHGCRRAMGNRAYERKGRTISRAGSSARWCDKFRIDFGRATTRLTQDG